MTELTADQVLQGIEQWATGLYQGATPKVEIALHGGRFSQADLERYATKDRAWGTWLAALDEATSAAEAAQKGR